jgi:Tol biopolymer transport system component
MAYVSDETGAPEVFLRPVKGSSVALRVSTAGGEYPFWRADGRELYYRAPDGSIMGVTITLGPKPVLSKPGVILADPPFSRTIRSFEVTPDGERFVAFGREDPLLFTLVTNWQSRVASR